LNRGIKVPFIFNRLISKQKDSNPRTSKILVQSLTAQPITEQSPASWHTGGTVPDNKSQHFSMTKNHYFCALIVPLV
jgi:hypothetical protein